MSRFLGRVALIATLVLLPLAAWAQTAQVGQVSGTVIDASGGTVPGATVKLSSEERGVSRDTVTDATGKFLFALVPLGKYDVTVSLTGFSTTTVQGNLVEAEKTTIIPITLKVATVEVTTTVTGETPIVDPTNQTQQTRLRVDEFEKMPLGRNYQTLMGQAPGVVGTGNVNAHGALTSNNLFMFDGVNTTDPTTGTFGANLNYESIQEILIRTASVSAEFGRATGAIVDVITKSGTNQFKGSFKFLFNNDDWNAQNTTKSEVASADGTFTSLARTKFDQVNKTYSGTIGGPIIRNHAWFFVAYEDARATSPQTQLNPRPGITPENYQQTTISPFLNARGTVQLTPTQNLWVKVTRSPTDGFVRNDYWPGFGGITAEREAATSQDQGGTSVAGQYTTVLSSNWTAEAMVAYATSFIDVVPFERSQLNNGAPYWDLVDNRIYNGAAFDGFVKRPRTQVGGAVNYFTNLMGNTHSLKLGVDWQSFNSENSFRFPNNQIFYGFNFDPAARAFAQNDSREDYDDAPSKSTGQALAIYLRDKFQLGPRVSVEAGLRIEHQSGESDIEVATVNATNLAPRISASYALTSDGKTLLVGSYGRFYDSILQGFSDSFANVPQQTNYSTYVWDGTQYVFSSRSESGANTFSPNTEVSPRHLDEGTIGFEHQLNQRLGFGVRYIARSWGNFVDDIRTFNPDGTLNRVVANIDSANRKYNGIEFTVDKRWSANWSASGSYTYSKTTGNHFGDDFTALEDFAGANCRQTVDPGLFNGGTFPCSEIYANLEGKPTFDRPHLIKLNGAYTRPIGPVNLTAGLVGAFTSKTTYTKSRTVSVLSPTTGAQFAQMTYRYEPLGSDRVDGLLSLLDLSVEATMRAFQMSQFGVKFDVFNLFNNEEKINVSNTTWCDSTATSTCATTVANYGTATTRGAFAAPRTFRVTALVRF
jgi:Carboxypeptidase regulatory-like domain